MSRALTAGLDTLQLFATARHPAYQVEIWDVRSSGGLDTIGKVVVFNATGSGSFQILTGPKDFTAYTTSVQMQEEAGDYASGGIVATQATLTLVDPDGLMDPTLLSAISPSDPAWATLNGRYFRAGNVVVLRYGDARLDTTEWPIVFTGELVGQYGYLRGRSDGPDSSVQLRALGREAHFTRFKRTSNVFGTGTSFLTAALAVAQEEMGLDLDEIALSGWGAQTFGHTSVQFVEENPLSMLAKLMFPSGQRPKFNGLGLLTQTNSLTTKAPVRFYDSNDLFRRLEQPWSDFQPANCVVVTGLDKNLSQVVQPRQLLATADITTGYFASNEDFNIFWSNDKTLVALNPEGKIVLKSLTGGVSFTGIASPGTGGGTIGIKVTVDTGYAPWIAVVFLVLHIVFSAIPDLVIAFGEGVTIPIGRIIQAILLGGALIILTKVGRFQFEFYGEPMEYVYKEIRAAACVEGTNEFDENQLTIENHLINTQTDADNAARDMLFLQRAKANVRSVEMIHDLRVEPDDVFELADGRRYLVGSVGYSLVRDAVQAVRASMACYEITAGVVA